MAKRRHRKRYTGPDLTAHVDLGPGDHFEITLGEINDAGDTTAVTEGAPVVIAGGLPGEVVIAEVLKRFPERIAAKVVQVLQSAPERVEPECQYFLTCSGCQWQHVSYGHQLELKRNRVQREIDRRQQSKNINNALREKNDREREEVNRAAIDFKRATTADARKQVGREIIALGVAKAPRNFMAMNRRKGTDHLKKFVSGNVKSMNNRGHVSGDGVDRAEAVVRDYEAGMMNMEQAKHKVAETLQDNYNAKSHYSQMAENDLVNYNNRLHDERIERMREVRRPRLLPEPVVRRPSRYTNRPEVKSMNMEQLNGYNRAIAMRAARENELQTQEKEQASLAGVFTKTRATMERLVS